MIFNKAIVKFDIDTSSGQSGCGLNLKDGIANHIIGVNFGGSSEDNFNKATLITKNIVDQIKEWILTMLFKYKDTFEKEIKKYVETEIIGGKLNLSNMEIGIENIEIFLEKNLCNLTFLNLSKNILLNEGIKYLIDINFDHLKILNLSENKIGNKGIEYLLKIYFGNLTELNLSSNNIGKLGIKYLSKINFKFLENLNLSDNFIQFRDTKYLSKMFLDSLKELNLEDNLNEINKIQDLQYKQKKINKDLPEIKKLNYSYYPINENFYGNSAEFILNIKSEIEKKQIQDRRKKIVRPSNSPYSPKGVITIEFGNKKFQASGDLIYSNIVLTAAHNVYDKEKNESAKNIKLYPV